jgi:hypothetical protein
MKEITKVKERNIYQVTLLIKTIFEREDFKAYKTK